MRDYDIRKRLRIAVYNWYSAIPDTLVVEELGILQGKSRVDLAVVNGTFYAYEIKSSRDNLARLPRQIELYGRVFDYLHLVTTEEHLRDALGMLPEWWGVLLATEGDGGQVGLALYREPVSNPCVDVASLVRLLWRDEALALLTEVGADRGVRTKPRREIWQRVCEVFSLDEIKLAVRECLKRRASGAVGRPLQ